jgi:hypothetical protein
VHRAKLGHTPNWQVHIAGICLIPDCGAIRIALAMPRADAWDEGKRRADICQKWIRTWGIMLVFAVKSLFS